MAQTVGVVDVFIAGQAAEHRLAELGEQGVSAVATRPAVGQRLTGKLAQSQSVVQFTKRQQARVGRHPRSVELQLQSGVEIDPQVAPIGLTRRSSHPPPRKQPSTC